MRVAAVLSAPQLVPGLGIVRDEAMAEGNRVVEVSHSAALCLGDHAHDTAMITRISRARRAPVLFAAIAIACFACTKVPPPPAATSPATHAPSQLHFEIGAIDSRIDPCTDFYEFACGGWRAAHPIPPDRTRWSRYSEMEVVNLERERAIVEESAQAGRDASAPEQRVGAYYRACMDERAIDARGLAPIRDLLGRIDVIHAAIDAEAVIAELQMHGIDALFSTFPDIDFHDASTMVLSIDRGELGLPSPTDYTNTDSTAIALRQHYRDHLERLFQLLGAAKEEASRKAERTIVFETNLAETALSPVERRQLELQYHPMTLAELRARVPKVDWPTHFLRVGATAIDRINVVQPAWMDAANTALTTNEFEDLRDYLSMLVAREFAAVLPSALEGEVFDFDRRILRGAQEMAPRWQRCLNLVDRDLGDDVGRIFLARHFSDDARARMKAMIDALLAAYHADIASSDWLGPSARAAAESKLSKMLVVVGASNRPRVFDGLRIDADDPFGNSWRAQAFDLAQRMSDLGKPTDREKFFDALPQGLDGFGAKLRNATGFTAGFLQPPIFDPRMDDAVNFGGLGSVIGHELTHHFDDEGRKFDEEGNLRSWWSPEDIARFEERAQCFIDEYSKFHTDDGTPLDGKLTLGENLADNGGIRLSYAALQPSEVGPKLDGFTPAQRFFLAWGQIRCENVTPESARRQAQTDGHSAGRWRVDGVVPNLPEFARAFSCTPGAAMAPAKRCKLW